jgi:hypothetical protein
MEIINGTVKQLYLAAENCIAVIEKIFICSRKIIREYYKPYFPNVVLVVIYNFE